MNSRTTRMGIALVIVLLVSVLPATAFASSGKLTPLPDGEALWIAGPNAFTDVDGSFGQAVVNQTGATITVHTTGLTPGDAYTAWAVYFNDSAKCTGGTADPPSDTRCDGRDLAGGLGGIVRLDGKVVGDSGMATFSGRVNVGDTPEAGPPGVVPYDPRSPDFHIVIRSHGPMVPSQMPAQIHSFDGGCPDNQRGDVPVEIGECADVQLFVFETAPAP